MRIEASRLWLLGAALLQLGGHVVADVVVQVETYPGSRKYLKYVQPGTEAVYTVTSKQDITVTDITLKEKSGLSVGDKLLLEPTRFIKSNQLANIIIQPALVEKINGTGSRPQPLVFVLNYTLNTKDGSSGGLQRDLAIISDPFGITMVPEELQPSDWKETFTGPSQATGITSAPTSATDSGLPTSTIAVNAVSAPDSGLPTGAIAGIAVAAGLLALVALGVLTWFLLRRRRRNRAGAVDADGGYGGGRSGDIIPDKEAAASGAAVDTPHSPYSDDGLQRDDSAFVGTSHHHLSQAVGQDVTTGVGAAAIAGGAGVAGLMATHHHQEQQQHQQADFTPYSDHPPQPSTSSATASPAMAGAGVATTSTTMPQSAAAAPRAASIDEEQTHHVAAMQAPRTETGMSGRYAHLVEDHMTPEDIARIEAEERELDAAIEHARGTMTL